MENNNMTQTVENTSEVLYQIEKSLTEIVQISKRMYRGKTYMDIRVFYKDKNTGEFRYTTKGMTLTPEVFRRLVETAVLAEKEMM